MIQIEVFGGAERVLCHCSVIIALYRSVFVHDNCSVSNPKIMGAKCLRQIISSSVAPIALFSL